MLHRPKAPYIGVKPHRARIREALLCLIETAGQMGKPITQPELLQAVFLADRTHLNVYGRPITFDRYKATKAGPVATGVKDLLRRDPVKAGYPWHRRKEADTGTFIYESARQAIDETILAPSDREGLVDALITVRRLGFEAVRQRILNDPAYLDAWDATDSSRQVFDMSYVMMFDVPSLQKAQDLAFASRHL
jgi:hypothetical protein